MSQDQEPPAGTSPSCFVANPYFNWTPHRRPQEWQPWRSFGYGLQSPRWIFPLTCRAAMSAAARRLTWIQTGQAPSKWQGYRNFHVDTVTQTGRQHTGVQVLDNYRSAHRWHLPGSSWSWTTGMRFVVPSVRNTTPTCSGTRKKSLSRRWAGSRGLWSSKIKMSKSYFYISNTWLFSSFMFSQLCLLISACFFQAAVNSTWPHFLSCTKCHFILSDGDCRLF